MRKDEMSLVQHKAPSDEEQEETARSEAGAAGKKRRRGQWAFVRWKREDQLKAFFGWLPQELHDALESLGQNLPRDHGLPGQNGWPQP